MPLITPSGNLTLFPSSRQAQIFPAMASAASIASSFCNRPIHSISISFSRNIPWLSSLKMPSSRLLATISSCESKNGGSNGQVSETDVIFLSVGGMTCGGCAASVKRILESQPQVASATVYLEKENAVVWTVPEAKDSEHWKQQLGVKLANHLTTCGFKSEFQGQGEAIGKEL